LTIELFSMKWVYTSWSYYLCNVMWLLNMLIYNACYIHNYYNEIFLYIG